jgi:hypothetical protein
VLLSGLTCKRKEDSVDTSKMVQKSEDKPSEADGRALLVGIYGGIVKVVSFTKTDGQTSDQFGVKYYLMSYTAELEPLVDVYIHPWERYIIKCDYSKSSYNPSDVRKKGEQFRYTGAITFQKSEIGWKAK